MQPVDLFGGSFSWSTDGTERRLHTLLRVLHEGVRAPSIQQTCGDIIFGVLFVLGRDVETRIFLHGGNGIDRGEPWMSTGNQGGNSVASVNTGAGSHICMKQLAVSHTCFLVSSGACGLIYCVVDGAPQHLQSSNQQTKRVWLKELPLASQAVQIKKMEAGALEYFKQRQKHDAAKKEQLEKAETEFT